MKKMSSKEIKDRYGEFVDAARREPVVHTSHGRPTLVTLSIDHARQIPALRDRLDAMEHGHPRRSLLDYAGKGRKLSRFKSDAEIEEFLESEREAWP
jgi:prevent-host-death family protein